MKKKELYPPIPEGLLPYFSKAKKEGERGALKAIEFSRRTYQLLVRDFEDKEEYWSFLHLDEKGCLQESFCLCSEEKGEELCSHILSSLFAIYNKGVIPLHLRYDQSLVKELFYRLFLQEELSFPALVEKIALLAVTPEGKSLIEELRVKEEAQGEEESLQFSDLEEEEIEAMEKKRMGKALRFHFSPFSSLAKAIFVLGELGNPSQFSYRREGGDILFLCANCDIEFSVRLKEDEGEELLPRIKETFGDRLREILFDEESRTLHCRYVDHENVIEEDQIASFLSDFGMKLASWAKFSIGSEEPIYLKRRALFDEEKNLHIDPYVNRPGDLEEALFFERWIYTREEGFLYISGPIFSRKIVLQDDVEAYILEHQAEFGEIEGFHFHTRPIQEQAHFYVDSLGNLHVEKGVGAFEGDREIFGSILYVPHQGFYPIAHDLGFPTGIIPKRRVASFLRKHQQELEMVPGLFLDRSPLSAFHVRAEYREGEIWITPEYQLTSAFEGLSVQGYEGWIYVEAMGFYSIVGAKIPFELMEERVVSEEELIHFLDCDWDTILPYCEKIPPMLRKIVSPSFEIDRLHWSPASMKWEVLLLYGGIPLEELWKEKKAIYFGKEGWLDLREQLFLSLKKILSEPKSLSSLELIRLLFTTPIVVASSCVGVVDGILSLHSEKELDISDLQSTLRDYQKIAVNWLWFLYTHRLSALLADDMGLGKTHEAMGLIAGLFRDPEEKNPSCLIVCPTSLLFHWEEKLAKFLPSRKSYVYWGKDRLFKKEEIILTSYTIFRRDFAEFTKESYSLAIFDEVQLAKNHQSRLSHAVKEVKARMKLGLSGTPIENRLRELKTLFDLLLPGLMPKEEEFTQQFAIPIEKLGDRRAEEALQKRIRPFILRRTKQEVLKELPEKIEEVEKASMEEEQRLLYQEAIDNAKKGVLQGLIDGEKPKSLIPIFALITQLKKICNHPALYYKDVAGYAQYASGKWELFKELLEEALASQQKVVIFSHFLQMLDIIELFLAESNISFSRLRGETKNRKEEVERFQNDPECRVFVASLQAGGLGIDLTAASVVIHYDRWWNFAKENQATDRAHRIGQKRGVQVFKLMTLATIEEHIDILIRKKADLHEKMVGRDEVDLIKGLSADDLRALFSFPHD